MSGRPRQDGLHEMAELRGWFRFLAWNKPPGGVANGMAYELMTVEQKKDFIADKIVAQNPRADRSKVRAMIEGLHESVYGSR